MLRTYQVLRLHAPLVRHYDKPVLVQPPEDQCSGAHPPSSMPPKQNEVNSFEPQIILKTIIYDQKRNYYF